MSDVTATRDDTGRTGPAASFALAAAASTAYRLHRAGPPAVGFLVWSTILYSRFAQNDDFTVYHQAWYLIAHGDLYPYVTSWGHYFARGDSEYGIWLIAPLYWIWPHDVVQLWVQDICIVWAEIMAFTWICELAGRLNRRLEAAWLPATGIILFVANPWILWAVSFDFHMEPLAMPFVVLLARDLINGRRRAWIWALLTGRLPAPRQRSTLLAWGWAGCWLADARGGRLTHDWL